MRIREADLGYFDVIWFAADRAGHVVVARSMESDVPEFVKSDANRTLRISERLACPKAIGRNRSEAFDVDKLTSVYGFFCYAADDPFESVYRIVGIPSEPRGFDELPGDVRALMEENRLPFDAAHTPGFEVVGGQILP